MSRWCAQHLRAAPHEKAPPVDFGRPLPPQRVAVSEVVDIEEMVYAPRYGESAPAAPAAPSAAAFNTLCLECQASLLSRGAALNRSTPRPPPPPPPPRAQPAQRSRRGGAPRASGLKGQIDASVRVAMHDAEHAPHGGGGGGGGGAAPAELMPLEIKSGRENISHRAQVVPLPSTNRTSLVLHSY
jgi:hypothetical protein